jgi:hypothetical protein
MDFKISNGEYKSYRDANGFVVIPDRPAITSKPKETIAGALIVDSLGACANPNYKRISI